MLENARRQVILVLLTIAAGLACNFLLKPGWGPDLQGGVQLIYEVPEESLDALVKTERTTVDAIMDQTASIIRERVDPTGQIGAAVTRRGATGLLIELPYYEDKADLDAIKNRISSLGKLEMRIVADNRYADEEGVTFELAKEKERLQKWLNEGGKELVLDNWKNIERFNEDPVNGPLAFGHLRWYPHLIEPQLENDKQWSRSFAKDTQSVQGITPMGPATVAVYEESQWNNGLVPESMQDDESPFLLEFVAINVAERGFRGEDLDPTGVSPGVAQDGRLAVHYTVKSELAGAYGDWSEKHLKEHSAIILNGAIRSAPYFESRIPGRGQISGEFTQAEVDELVKVLRTGSLKVEPLLLSERSVGPQLGAKSIELGQISLFAGAAAVFLFMLWYYRLAGVVACVSLLLNLFLLWSALLFTQATITLPGLGGIVLTLGMAVDANVLIYERIREEADRGKDMIRAVRAGFERAMSAILDSNITTFLTGLVLYNVGVGPVRGFAVTLMIGIVMTVFCQFFVSRLIFHFLIEGKKLQRFEVRRLFARPEWNYLSKARTAVIASLVFLGIGVLYSTTQVPSEVSLGIDFKGGANMQVLMAQPMTAEDVRQRLGGDAEFDREFHNFSVNTVEAAEDGTTRLFNIRLKLTDAMREQIEQDRAEWRQQRAAAEAAGETPPPPYEAPYVTQMRRIFGDVLAKPASSDAEVYPGTSNDAYAQINLHFQSEVSVAAAQQLLEQKKLPRPKVSVAGEPEALESKDLFVEWTTLPKTSKVELFDIVREALDGLQDTNGKDVLLSNPFPEAEEIQGRMVGELRNAAIGALILSWALIIFYLRIRFHEYKYGIAAVCALLHDVLVTFVVVVAANAWDLVHAEINLNMIACFLTIIGYSVNDTIVIFDRIRENIREQAKMGGRSSFRELINLSVNQTLSRTILTTGLTLFVVLAQLLVNWGTESDLESFAFGMFVGMISGTYSTIFIAAPVLVWIHDRSGGDARMLAEQEALREEERAAEAAAKAEAQAP